jgi:excisionase family DNA binding protein
MKPMTIPEACTFLKMEKSTLHKLMKARAFQFYRRPGSRVILLDQDDLEAWLRTGLVQANSEEQTPCRRHQDKTVVATGAVLDIVPENVYHRNPCYR